MLFFVFNHLQGLYLITNTQRNHSIFLGEKIETKARISGKFERRDFFGFTPKPLPIPDSRMNHWKKRKTYNRKQKSRNFWNTFSWRFSTFGQVFVIFL